MIKYDHLIGHDYVEQHRDCLSLIRDFFSDNFGIVIPNYARPHEFWKDPSIDLYRRGLHQSGFRPLDCHPLFYRPGDLILCAIRSSIGNHGGILVENNKFLHHMPGTKSTVEPYSGLYRRTTIGVYRHPLVPPEEKREVVDLATLLPKPLQDKYGSSKPVS